MSLMDRGCTIHEMCFRRRPIVWGVALTVGLAIVLGHDQKHVETRQHQDEPVSTIEDSFSTATSTKISADVYLPTNDVEGHFSDSDSIE